MIAAATARIRTTVWGIVLSLVAMIAAASAYQIWKAQRQALEDSQAQAVRFVAGAESAFNRSILGIDVLLAGTDEFLGLSNSVAQWVDPEVASQLLRSAASQSLTVRFLALVDENGKLFASSEPVGSRLERELPPAFIANAMAQNMSTLVISAPVDSVASMERVLYFGRYIRMADGSNLLAVAEVPTTTLTTVLMQGTDIAGLEVTLERSDGKVLLGVPNPDVSNDLVRTTPQVANTAVAGEAKGRARLSDVPALVVSRPLLYRDLWITASIPLDAALSKWRFDRNVVAAAALLFCALLLLAGAFAVDYLRRIAAARLAIAQSKMTLDQALESMVSGFVLLDAEQRVVQWNRRFLELFPWLGNSMAVGLPFRQVLEISSKHHLPGATEAELGQWVEERVQAQITHSAVPHEQILPTGEHIEITERLTPEAGTVITYHDVSAMRKANAEIETLAFYDALTGLPNRRLLLDRLAQAIAAAERSGQWGGLLFLDLDHFKVVNDTMGHEVGDQLLIQVAQRLTVCVRDTDTVARLGGDEFVVMLKNLSTDKTQAAQVAKRIGEDMLQTLNQPYLLGDLPYRSTSSLGATLFAANEHNAGELLKQADIAMYQVKAQRGNALCFFDPQMQAAISNRAQLEVDLRNALAQGEFELHYQPQFAAHGGVVGAEALLRWRHPLRGLLAPGAFIEVAEESELIVHMGVWVLRTACEQLAAWQSDPQLRSLQLSVNVSARQFHQSDFVQSVTHVVQATGIPPHLLKLELTESLMLEKVDECVLKMDQLKCTGIRFSLDDFGTGYSSLAYLTRLPLDQLKIDQSFVRNLGVRHTDGLIVQTIVGMAGSLGLEVIAEGVETEDQKDLLAQYGCTLYQGYLFARPAPVAQLEALIAAG